MSKDAPRAETRFFTAIGKVQKVMFRQTLIRAMIKGELKGGASNCKTEKNRVFFTIQGNQAKIQEIISFLMSGKELNDWHAKVQHLEEANDGLPYLAHQVHTENVDDRQWNPNVVMYL